MSASLLSVCVGISPPHSSRSIPRRSVRPYYRSAPESIPLGFRPLSVTRRRLGFGEDPPRSERRAWTLLHPPPLHHCWPRANRLYVSTRGPACLVGADSGLFSGSTRHPVPPAICGGLDRVAPNDSRRTLGGWKAARASNCKPDDAARKAAASAVVCSLQDSHPPPPHIIVHASAQHLPFHTQHTTQTNQPSKLPRVSTPSAPDPMASITTSTIGFPRIG